MRGVGEIPAVQRDHALVAAAPLSLVDGHRQDALTDQLAGPRGLAERGHPVRVEPGIGAQPVRRVEIDHDHVDRPVGLGLELEAALELQRRAEKRGEGRRLADSARDGIRVAVAREDRVERGAEPDASAAHVQRLHGVGQHDVVGAFGNDLAHGWTAQPACPAAAPSGALAAPSGAAPRHQARMPFWA